MPEQPADPLHYEMKIPPEPHSSQVKRDDDNSTATDSDKKSDRAKDTNVGRDEDQPQEEKSPR